MFNKALRQKKNSSKCQWFIPWKSIKNLIKKLNHTKIKILDPKIWEKIKIREIKITNYL